MKNNRMKKMIQRISIGIIMLIVVLFMIIYSAAIRSDPEMKLIEFYKGNESLGIIWMKVDNKGKVELRFEGDFERLKKLTNAPIQEFPE
jgi:hypothetical protein